MMSDQPVIPIYEGDKLILTVPSYNVEESMPGDEHQELLIGNLINLREEIIFQGTYLTEQHYKPYGTPDDLFDRDYFQLPIHRFQISTLVTRRLSVDKKKYQFFDIYHDYSKNIILTFLELTTLLKAPESSTHPRNNIPDEVISVQNAGTYPIAPMYLVSSKLLPYELFSTTGQS